MATPVLRPGDVVRIRDERWRVTRIAAGDEGALVEVCGRDRGNRGARACFVLPCEPCERLPHSTTTRIIRPATWRRELRAALAVATPSPESLRTRGPASLAVLPFQLEPALAVTRGLSSRILIADEVGLGKTVQAGLIISEVLLRRPDGHVLIVSPAGLRAQWCDELRDRLSLDAVVLDSAALARHAWSGHGNPWSAQPVIVTSLDYVKRPEVLRSLEALVWDVIVFDEAHSLAGHSDRAIAAFGLADRARTVVMLTATPHSGDESAFARLCGAGDVRHEFPLLVFRRTRQDVGLASCRRSVSIRVRPTLEEAEMHRAVTTYARLIWNQKGASSAGARFVAAVLCRRACSSATSLARSIERRLALLAPSAIDDLQQMRLPLDDVRADDEEPSAELGLPGLDDAGEERHWLERLLQLAVRATHRQSKLRALVRLLRRARQPAIVFTEYRDTLAMLATALSAHSPLLLHGGLTTAERHTSARQFNAGAESLLLATDAASEGLNLHQHCRLVINLELPWTPVRLEQRIGRVERIGQTRRVHAVHVLAAGTTEEESVARLLLRTRRVDRALGELRVGAHSEDAIAQIAIGGETERPSRGGHDDPPRLPRNVITRDLRAEADSEAERIRTARALASSTDVNRHDRLPCVTVVRHRRHDRRSYWIYRVSVLDNEDHFVWDTLLAFAADMRIVSRQARDVRAWLATALEHLAPEAAKAHAQAFQSAATALRAPLQLAASRERAIVEALAERRARLSAGLLQGGLFDRRNERSAASQDAVIEEALARCGSRLREIERREHLTADPPSLGFALLRR